MTATETACAITLSFDDGIAILRIDSPPVNALSFMVRQGLAEAFAQASASPSRALVIYCAGRTFVAGADIAELGATIEGVKLPDLIGQLDTMSMPVVVAIHGTALGGGLELALGAHYRVAVPSAKMGLPEVKLGLLPGAGGTQRLPRLIGPEAALDIMVSGRMVGANEALGLGLIDAIVAEDALLTEATAFARQIAERGAPLPRVRDKTEKLGEGIANPGIFDAFAKANARKIAGLDAPQAIIACVCAATTAATFEDGMAIEAQEFNKLLDGDQSAAQRYYFFAERKAGKIPGLTDDIKPRPIAKVGVVGAGTMGGGIAMNFANIAIPVVISDVTPAGLERGLGVIRKNYERSAKRRGQGADYVDGRMGHITGTLDLADMADCDLVIEAAFEQLDIKQDIFARLDAICKPGAILASNTSALDLNKIAAATCRPQDVVGLHFFSPANVMRLLEVVRGELTALDVVATAMKLAGKIGKIAVLSGVCDGFIGNRILFKRQEQAIELLKQGALPKDIDRVLVAFGFPMGAFAMEDLAGIDIGWDEADSSGRTIKEVMCEAGRRGQKVGAGYYDYDEAGRPVASPAAEDLIRQFVTAQAKPQRQIDDQEILERCIFPMINEGAKILDEGIALRASDIDVAWVNGYGWPVYRGGPMFYADHIGLATVLAGLNRYRAAGLDGFEPAPLLERLVAEGRAFADLEATPG